MSETQDQDRRAFIKALQSPGGLEKRLAELDRGRECKRIFLMGCGRSGAWLLTSMMTAFEDLVVISKELPVEAFGIIELKGKHSLLLKRMFVSYQTADTIPDSIHLLYVVRHPFDVLTSTNPVTKAKYHITPERWAGETAALKRLLDRNRPHLLVVTYEDLVRHPQEVLERIAEAFDLSSPRDSAKAIETAKLPSEAVSAMHGRRPIDHNSIGRYRNDPEAIAYIRKISSRIRPSLDWMARHFGYDLVL